MRDYAKVSPQFWTRGSGKRLRGDADAQVLALYLVTCPNANMVGVYYVPFVSIAHETGLGEKRTRSALKRLSEADFAHYDEDAELAWVPNMAGYQIGDELKEGDKRRGGPIRAEVEKIGKHPFVIAFWQRYGEGYGLGRCPYRLAEAPEQHSAHPPPMPLPSPLDAPSMGHGAQSGRAGEEQEQEQEQEQERVQGEPTCEPLSSSPSATGSAGVRQSEPETKIQPKPTDAVGEVFAHWLRGFQHAHPRAKDRKASEKERRSIRNALALGYTAEDLKLAVEGLFLSPFHTGENDRRKEYLEVDKAFREGNLEAFREAAIRRREAREQERKRAADGEAPSEATTEMLAKREAISGRFRALPNATSNQSSDEPHQLAIGESP